MPDTMPERMSEYNIPERKISRSYVRSYIRIMHQGWGSLEENNFIFVLAAVYILLGCVKARMNLGTGGSTPRGLPDRVSQDHHKLSRLEPVGGLKYTPITGCSHYKQTCFGRMQVMISKAYEICGLLNLCGTTDSFARRPTGFGSLGIVWH